jgi:hypothetical protein
MLPFLKHKQDGSSSTPPDSVKRPPDEGAEEFDSLESAAEDLIAAIHSKNVKAVTAALRAAFELCDSEPHNEGSHPEIK